MFYNNFNEQELEYINADIDDSNQDVYREYVKNTAFINCKLPKGAYHIIFNLTKDAKIAYGNLRVKGAETHLSQNHLQLGFILNRNTELYFPVSAGGGSASIVTNLRKHIVLHQRDLKAENAHLIAKDIKNYTDLGIDYNRESFYDTIEECLLDGEDLMVDKSKPITDCDVKYLRYMRLEQLGYKLCAEQNSINSNI